ncbi:MAG: TOBE domain-containing protein, partial [Rhodoglobus sp.]|nr:TOBE domain-containing protein [Rhodoglobus sp.]
KDRAQRHSGEVTVGVRPEKLTLHSSEPKQQSGTNILGPGRVTDVSFSGMSTQYLVTTPGLGIITVFAQNLEFGAIARVGDEVWVSWTVDHGFGLLDEPEHQGKFSSDTSTATIATQTRHELLAEIEEA